MCKDTGTDAKDTSVPYQGDTHSSTASSRCNGQWCLRTRWRRYIKPIFLAWGCVQDQTVETVDGQINQTLNHHGPSPPPHLRFQRCLSKKMFCCQGFDLIRPLKPTSFTNRPTLNYGGQGVNSARVWIIRPYGSSNKKLLGTSASLLVTSALLVVTRFATRNKCIASECLQVLVPVAKLPTPLPGGQRHPSKPCEPGDGPPVAPFFPGRDIVFSSSARMLVCLGRKRRIGWQGRDEMSAAGMWWNMVKSTNYLTAPSTLATTILE